MTKKINLETMKASEWLQRRHDELAKTTGVRWVNRCPMGDDEACLLIGGKWELATPFQGGNRARELLRRVVRNDNLPRWNDSPRRTLAQVLRALLKAKALAVKEGN